MGFNKPKKTGLVLVIFLMLSGCISYGPVNEANYEQLIKAALPPDAGAVKMSAKGGWCKDKDGFKKIITASFRQPDLPVSGVIVITEKALFFLKWHGESGAYIILARINHDRIQSLRLDSFGRARLIAIQEIGSTFYSFDLAKGIFVDKTKMEKAFQLLQAMQKTSGSSAV